MGWLWLFVDECTASHSPAQGCRSPKRMNERYEWEAANRVSQRLAHSSTPRHAGELNFRVRDGYGCYLAAVAALTPTNGIEPLQWTVIGRSTLVCIAQSSSRLDHPEYSTVVPVCGMTNGVTC